MEGSQPGGFPDTDSAGRLPGPAIWAELRRKLAAAHAQRPQGGAARGADSEAHREATLREQLSNAQVELSGLRAQVQAELHGRTGAAALLALCA